jgi:fumarate hydratase class II
LTSDYRVEKDTMGEVKIPKEAYYGAQTKRAADNFNLSGLRFPSGFIKALGLIKLAAARANGQLSLLDKRLAEVIEKAAQEVVDGKMDQEFILDVFQTGSGTSTNMNANEVIANRANQILTGKMESKDIHPNDHVNMCQSTNDVFPTAIHVSALQAIEKDLVPSLRLLQAIMHEKASQFEGIVKAGRTHLQDAVPVTLGQEFSGYATMVENGILRIEKAKVSLLELPLGGTAVGTGLNAHPDYARYAIDEVASLTGIPFKPAKNYFEAMKAKDACVEVSGALKTIASSLMKIANDLRLLSSGPFTGLGEIELPALQPGSSIMPGKVNPVIPEAVNLAASQIIGNDTAITVAAQLGELELNMGMPLIAYALLQSIELAANASIALAEKCVKGVTANAERSRRSAESSLALVTAIAPLIGYDKAAHVSKKALAEGKTLSEVILAEGLLDKQKLSKALDVEKMAKGSRIQ